MLKYLRGAIYNDLAPFNAVILRRTILMYYDFTAFGACFSSQRLFVCDKNNELSNKFNVDFFS